MRGQKNPRPPCKILPTHCMLQSHCHWTPRLRIFYSSSTLPPAITDRLPIYCNCTLICLLLTNVCGETASFYSLHLFSLHPMGLSYEAISPFYNIVNQGLLDKPVFTLYYRNQTDKNKAGGPNYTSMKKREMGDWSGFG